MSGLKCLRCNEAMDGIHDYTIRQAHNCCGGKPLVDYMPYKEELKREIKEKGNKNVQQCL